MVLYDRLLMRRRGGAIASIYTSDEVLAVVAHEIGHWSLGHVVKHFLFNMVSGLGVNLSGILVYDAGCIQKALVRGRGVRCGGGV